MSDQRLSFVRAVRYEGMSVSSACRHFKISRPTGYEILRRYDEFDLDGLIDRSRAPLGNSRSVPDSVRDLIIDFKGQHPSWGPKKLRAKLAASQPDISWPATSTFGRILDSVGLVQKPRHRNRPPRLGELAEPSEANRVWSADFKGQFCLGSGSMCFPLTVTDNYSRFLIRCHGLPDVTSTGMWPIMVGAFQEFGLPDLLRIDNGNPFAATSSTGLSRFQVNLIKLGIEPERIDPGSPQQNGRHERMHRTLKAEATKPPASTMRAQQTIFDAWRSEYNQERPHEALGMATPASIYSQSLRRFPERMPDFEYDEAMTTRKVRMNGCIKFYGHETFISETLIGDVVGIKPIDDLHCAIYAGFLAVAIIYLPTGKLLDGKEAAPILKNIRAKPKQDPSTDLPYQP